MNALTIASFFYCATKAGVKTFFAKGLHWVYYGCALGALALRPPAFATLG
jgi:hypothetical protein